MRVAVIGSGISGLVAAYQLRGVAEVHLFEANGYVGGHTHTVDVEVGGGRFAVDTGFIVFNERTYPNFCRLIDRLGVAWQPTDMSFGFMDDGSGLEYAAPNLSGLFAQLHRVADPRHWQMLRDIPRFNRYALKILGNGHAPKNLGEVFDSGAFGTAVRDHYLVPMLSAIWSADRAGVRGMPAIPFLNFMKYHGLLSINQQPVWRVIRGGSRNYVAPLVAQSGAVVHVNAPVRRITRDSNAVTVEVEGNAPTQFDHVVIATHSDQALRMLADPTPAERDILGAIPYQANAVDLHTDRSVLPKSRRAWASWNYRMRGDGAGQSTVTYHMNRLQRLRAPAEFCVSLNQREHIDPARVLGRFEYAHPVYRASATGAQARFAEISGVNRTHYCGAYWGYGFHEDGVNSALAACRYFGRGSL